MTKPLAVVVGIGPKNGAAFVRALAGEGYRVAMLSRSTELSSKLAEELGGANAKAAEGDEVKLLDPRDIASAVVALTMQPRSAWSFEVDVRPKNEPW